MLKVIKCKVILGGFFSLPDVFIDRENYLQRVILDSISEAQLRNLYEEQDSLDLDLENFQGPRMLPVERERNRFWESMLDYEFWAPLFYVSHDKLKVKFKDFDDRESEHLFRKINIAAKFPSRFHIRVFPLGGFSIQMITELDLSFSQNKALTAEDLEIIVYEFFDSIRVDLSMGENTIIENQRVENLFEILGNTIRKKFLVDAKKNKYLGMARHAILDIEGFEGNWSIDEIKRLCGIEYPVITNLEDLLKHDKLGNPYEKYRIKEDIVFSGQTCTLLCPKKMRKKGRKYFTNEIYDAVEFVYLRKLMINEYGRFITKNLLEIVDKYQHENFFVALWNRILQRKLTWIDECFLSRLGILIELEKRMWDTEFLKNVILKISERAEYEMMLEEIRKSLADNQEIIMKYDKQMVERIDFLVSVIEEMIAFSNPIKVLL
ncbi:MAG: hypothetical protein HXS54_03070 [Theionarchaea archaeon]|nr:hypothetical protein [Theionarchaea archaeon]